MTILVLAEHDNAELKSSTLHTLGAAQKIGGEIHVLVVGNGASAVVASAAQVSGVAKVLSADLPGAEALMAEAITAVTLQIAKSYSHILAPATGFGKNILPRV